MSLLRAIPEASATLLAMSGVLALANVAGVWNAVLTGLQRMDVTGRIALGAAGVQLAGIGIVLASHGGLLALAGFAGIAQCTAVAWGWAAVRIEAPEAIGRPGPPDGPLLRELSRRILVLDGAMGTAIQALDLTADDFGGAALEGCNENLVLTRPEAIRKIHQDYIDAGADAITCSTFATSRFVLDAAGAGDAFAAINHAAVDAAFRARDAAQREVATLLGRVGLAGRAATPAADLTYIDQKRLELARALALRPRLLLLDEWLAGLNPTELLAGIGLVRSLRAEGVAVLMVEHMMDAIRALCDRCVVMNVGRPIAEGVPKKALADPEVVRAYLGDADA